MKYERLTKRGTDKEWGFDCDKCEHKRKCFEFGYCLERVGNRLAELEDDLEGGKLVRLPCKVGDTVWFLNRFYSISMKKDTIYEAKVVRVYFEKDRNVCLAVQIKNEYGTTEFPRITEIGETVFLTREEAEAKLKGQHNEELF